MPSRFQRQIQFWIPVSIVWVIPAPVISPHVHVQFHVQVEGRLGAAWLAAIGGAAGAVDDAGAEGSGGAAVAGAGG